MTGWRSSTSTKEDVLSRSSRNMRPAVRRAAMSATPSLWLAPAAIPSPEPCRPVSLPGKPSSSGTHRAMPASWRGRPSPTSHRRGCARGWRCHSWAASASAAHSSSAIRSRTSTPRLTSRPAARSRTSSVPSSRTSCSCTRSAGGASGCGSRVLGTSLNVPEIFDRLAAAVRPVLDFDIMATSFVESESIAPWLHVADGWPVPERSDRFEDFSFGTRLLSREPVLMRECESELDPTYPADRRVLEDRIRSFVAVPLIFGETVGALLGFAKRQPDWFDTSDLEIVEEIAQHVVVAIQHQRLAEEQRRLAMAEGRAQQLERRVQRLRGALSEQYGFGRILGQAPSLLEALERAAQVAPQETPVLLTGESGTGKELVAQAIHYASRRADGPCVAINCAALPDALIESELFGHERGAFTGADRQKLGRFELAAGGTLFLDEVGELAAAVQAKLLRVLQEREFQRVGGTATLKADFRLIVATNRNLTDAMARGQFREDLYYRLSVFPIHLPPLRDRGEDVVLLAQEFVRRLGERMGKGEPGLSRDARELLVSYPWPGNIRELQNAIERALIVSDAGLITAAQLGLTRPRLPSGEASQPGVPTPSGVAHQDAAAATLQELERHAITDALAKAKGNKTAAAATLGITRMQLYTKLRRLGLPSP